MMDDTEHPDGECLTWVKSGEGRMIFLQIPPGQIVLVGTGGTGDTLLPQLYRLLYALDQPIGHPLRRRPG